MGIFRPISSKLQPKTGGIHSGNRGLDVLWLSCFLQPLQALFLSQSRCQPSWHWWFSLFSGSKLASFVSVLHALTTSGFIQRVMRFRIKDSSSPERKGTMGSDDWNLVRYGKSWWATKAKNFSLQTSNSSKQPSLTATNVAVFGTWLGGFFRTVFTYYYHDVTSGSSCKALSTTLKSSTHRVAQNLKGNVEHPVNIENPALRAGESWKSDYKPRKKSAMFQPATWTPFCCVPWTTWRLQQPIPINWFRHSSLLPSVTLS